MSNDTTVYLTSVRSINKACREQMGKNVYVRDPQGFLPYESGYVQRITKARTKDGHLQVRLLWNGKWCNITPGDYIYEA